MEALHLPDNIKVHFAGSEIQSQFECNNISGVRYSLYTAYPFVERMVFGKGKSPIIKLPHQTNPNYDIPTNIKNKSLHAIQDSGLFTLMFGSMKGKCNASIINKWYDALVEYTSINAQGVTCVEIDCQKVLGVKEAWAFRERMRKDLPNNRIINVFHLEDGIKGLNKLIEFSDYIAISVPELRFAKKKEIVIPIAKYIKRKKPNIDIHLLGCTEKELLKKGNFCTSCDSTSHSSCQRYGFIQNHHISNINKEKVISLVGEKAYLHARKYRMSERNALGYLLSVALSKRKYEKYAGNQDYYKLVNSK